MDGDGPERWTGGASGGVVGALDERPGQLPSTDQEPQPRRTMVIVDFETNLPILREARTAVPEMTLTVESERAPGGPGADSSPIRLRFWAAGGDFDAFEAAVEIDPTVTRCKLLTDTGHRRLYRVLYTDEGMAWTPHPEWVRLDADLLYAETVPDGWAVRMRFPDRRTVSAFRSWFHERGLSFDLHRLFTETESPATGRGPTLTEKQYETLLTAWREGYFDVPRRTDCVGLAETLGVSDTAISQRVRRGIDVVLEYEFGERDRGATSV